MEQEKPVRNLTPNWKQVGIFLGLTFGLTYLLNLLLYLTVGYSQHPATTMLLQVQMLIPAAVAIALQLFLFESSPNYRLKEAPRWFFYYYLAYTAIYVLLAVSVLVVPGTVYATAASLFGLALSVGGLVLVVLLRLVSGKDVVQRAGLKGGKLWYWVVFGLSLVLVYGLMTGLNALFGLGQAVDFRDMLLQAAGSQATGLQEIPGPVLFLVAGLQSLVLAPFLGLLIAFGEEYGWRGYLQGELIKMGKVRGILVVGVIWGLWHAPVIMMGHNYPGYPVFGILVMTLYTIGLGFFLGYAMLKSGSVWLAAFLHALNNSVASFLMVAVYAPDDPVFSFGVGLYGIVVWAVVVGGLLLLGRREWTSPVAHAVETDIESEGSGENRDPS
jgi:membrane protease YdiL (CAAX protease family)